MSDLQTRYAELQAAGRVPMYGDGLTIASPSLAKNLLIKVGYQSSTGRFLYFADLDNHTTAQNADAARAAFEQALPHVKLAWTPSRGATGRPGLHGWLETYQELPTGKLFDADGNHIGELIGGEQHAFDPGDLDIPILTQTQIEHLRGFWTIQGGDSKGERWADRGRQGAAWTRGAQYIPVTLARLRTFLQNESGSVGTHLDALFDERKPFNRSDKAGSLMQNLMLFAHKLPGCANASFAVRCANVKAYWMAADSYGKVGEKDYDQSKDGDSLIAQIVNGDLYGPRDNPRQWKQPSWTKSQIAAAPAPEPPTPTRPRHRPAGDKEKQIGRLRRLLERRAFESYDDRLHYYIDDLAEYLGVTRRSVQNYLLVLASGDHPQIERGQEKTGPGGRAWLILLPAFWGANNSETTAKTAPESAPIWGENESATERAPMPQNAETTLQCKEEDHLNPCMPAPAAWPGGASYDPRHDATIGGMLLPWYDPAAMRVPAEPIDRRLPARPVRRQIRQQGQSSFIGRDGMAAKYERRKRYGTAPAPTPYRARARLPEETLPGSLRPVGAHGLDDPLPAPAGAADDPNVPNFARLLAKSREIAAAKAVQP